MWNTIENTNDIEEFMKKVQGFHDTCIKEIKYRSGAYVNENLGMNPMNSLRELKMIIQRQTEELSVIELEFTGLKEIHMTPSNYFTCEIHSATLLFLGEDICWCDEGKLSISGVLIYPGTRIIASKLRWRSIENALGSEEIYTSKPFSES